MQHIQTKLLSTGWAKTVIIMIKGVKKCEVNQKQHLSVYIRKILYLARPKVAILRDRQIVQLYMFCDGIVSYILCLEMPSPPVAIS